MPLIQWTLYVHINPVRTHQPCTCSFIYTEHARNAFRHLVLHIFTYTLVSSNFAYTHNIVWMHTCSHTFIRHTRTSAMLCTIRQDMLLWVIGCIRTCENRHPSLVAVTCLPCLVIATGLQSLLEKKGFVSLQAQLSKYLPY